jgi:hypothetical protein
MRLLQWVKYTKNQQHIKFFTGLHGAAWREIPQVRPTFP